jgi:hypothetical protein
MLPRVTGSRCDGHHMELSVCSENHLACGWSFASRLDTFIAAQQPPRAVHRWYCSEEDAKAAGFRKAFTCPR